VSLSCFYLASQGETGRSIQLLGRACADLIRLDQVMSVTCFTFPVQQFMVSSKTYTTYKMPMKSPSSPAPAEQQAKKFDAFAFYSNDFQRMKALLGKEEDSQEALAAVNDSIHGTNDGRRNVRRRGTGTRPIQEGVTRKTRISFEVHPSLIFDDLLFAEDANSDGLADQADDEIDILEVLLQRMLQQQHPEDGSGRSN